MLMNNSVSISPMGDAAAIIRFDDKINIKTHTKIKNMARYLQDNFFEGMIEFVPAFVTLTVYYDPFLVLKHAYIDKKDKYKTPYKIVEEKLKDILKNMDNKLDGNSRIVEIPVCYGGEFGPDLKFVAEHNNLTIEEVIDIHSACENTVYMIGFAPGFPYLAGMSEKIAAPRRKTPRLEIPAGAVGIAGKQTGVYPISTPGGWQLIGRTPLELFRPENKCPSLLQAGDIVKFKAISRGEYFDIKYKEEENLKWA